MHDLFKLPSVQNFVSMQIHTYIYINTYVEEKASTKMINKANNKNQNNKWIKYI